MNDLFKYHRGSEWRKWDLHVHTKFDQNYVYHTDASISNREQDDKQYPKIFIEHIYSIDNLGALAITGHNKGDWLDSIIVENAQFASESSIEKITIFPGVEIESSHGIHLLIIFNPESQFEEVNRNYRKTTWKETIEHFMTEIGITQGSNAVNTTEVIMEKAEKWDAISIFAHVIGNNKGFFEITSGTTKMRIYKHRLTQIFQIPMNGITNSGQKNIVVGRDPQYSDAHGRPKSVACITASDAKRLENIGRNNCWIKADPTFEGLKQIIYEPEEGVYIGEEPPRKIERNKIIDSITIYNSDRWFQDNEPICLNEGLVSIIGGKGTGKTAILDLIAYATGSYKCYEENVTKSKSFLKKALKELNGTRIKIEWDDGPPDEKEVGDRLEEFVEEGRIRYLPQDFIDQLCSEIGKSELEQQIENVIFQEIAEENKANFVDFTSYKKAQLKVISDKKDRVAKQLEEINLEIYELNELIISKARKSTEIKEINDAIKNLNAEMKKISDSLKQSGEQKSILDKLNSCAEQKSSLEKGISELKTNLLKSKEIENDISVFLEKTKIFNDDLKADLITIGISKEDIKRVKVVLYPENLQQILNSKKKEIDEEVKKQKDLLNNLNKKITELNGKIKLEKSKQDKVKKINKLLSDLKKKKDSLDKDIERIKTAKKKLKDSTNSRVDLFINYFELVFEEKAILKEIYSPLENILKESAEENENLFDFIIQFDINMNNMAEEGHFLIDLRAEGGFRHTKLEVFKEELENLKYKLNLNNQQISEEDKKIIKGFLEEIKNLFEKDGKTISSQLKEKYTVQDFDDWLFSTEYYSISYSIKFNGIELKNLSPGLKGVALLILFLELDKEDKRPIFIDQPEENLDNRSVYNTLVRYFRDAKKRRQVIIITHNPNLVVNTDSEQVIVADFDKGLEKQKSRIRYVSGALENTFKDEHAVIALEKQGIREHVCEILEGGEEAFEKREQKYGFKK